MLDTFPLVARYLKTDATTFTVYPLTTHIQVAQDRTIVQRRLEDSNYQVRGSLCHRLTI